VLDCLGWAVDGGCTGKKVGWVERMVPGRVLLLVGRRRGGGGNEVREDLAEAGGHCWGREEGWDGMGITGMEPDGRVWPP